MRWLAFALFLAVASPAVADEPFPSKRGHVNDYAKVFKLSERLELERKLIDHRKLHGEDIIVITLPRCECRHPEEYGAALLKDWEFIGAGSLAVFLILEEHWFSVLGVVNLDGTDIVSRFKESKEHERAYLAARAHNERAEFSQALARYTELATKALIRLKKLHAAAPSEDEPVVVMPNQAPRTSN